MGQAGSGFEVADGELDDGVTSMEGVDGDGGAVEIGHEAVVTPVRPETLLGAVGDTGAAHDEAADHLTASGAGGVGGVGDLGLTVGRVVDVLPSILGDGGDRRRDGGGVAAHGHRVAHVEPVQRGDRVVGPEPRVDPHGQRAGGAGAPHPGDELVDEQPGATLSVGGTFAHPGVQHFTGVGTGGQDRVIAEG